MTSSVINPIHPPRVIALSGKAGHGKDTAAKTVMQTLAKVAVPNQLAFADPLKEVVCKTLNIPTVSAYSENGKKRVLNLETGKTLRDALVEVSAAFKSFDKLVWVRKTFDEVHHRLITVITDMRQVHEEEYARQHSNLVVIKVIRDVNIYPDSVYEAPTEKEVDLIQADYVVYNNGTLEDLEKEVRKVTEEILTKKFGFERVPG